MIPPATRTLLAILLERQLTVMLPKEVEETLVVFVPEVEHARDDLVVASRLLEPAPDDVADIVLRDLALHVQRVHRRPERLAFFRHAVIQLVGTRPAPLA